MADNAAQLTDTLFYHARLIRRADSANSDDTSADVNQSLQSETSTPLTSSSSISTSTTSSSSSSSLVSPTPSQTTSSSIPTTPQPSNTSSRNGAATVQQNADTSSSPPSIPNPPAQNGSGSSSRPADTSQASQVFTPAPARVTDTSSKLAVDVSSPVSSVTFTHASPSLTGMISTPSDNTGGGDTTSGNVLAPTGGSQRNIVPIIIASVVGGVALISVLVLIFFLRQRRRRRQEVGALRWEAVHDPADEPLSPLSSDSGHELIQTRMIPSNLDGHVRLHWMNPAHTIGPEYLEPSQAESRGNSPSGASTVSTMSSVTFARPSVGQGLSQTMITSTGHYTPSGTEDDYVFNPDQGWLFQSRKTRPSLMTIVHER